MNRAERRKAKKNDHLYTLTVCEYYNEYDPDVVVRVTAAVHDLRSNETLEILEEWQHEHQDEDFDEFIEKWSDRVCELALKYRVNIRHITDGVPLEKCKCGCPGYMVRIITAADLAAEARCN